MPDWLLGMDHPAAVSACRTSTPAYASERETHFLPHPSRELAAPGAAERRTTRRSLSKRGNVYWSYLNRDGKRYSRSTGTGNLRQAERIEQRFKDELNLKRHQIVEPQPDMLLSVFT